MTPLDDVLMPVRDIIARLEAERDELRADRDRWRRTAERMGRANNEACDQIHELRAMVERAHGSAAE